MAIAAGRHNEVFAHREGKLPSSAAWSPQRSLCTSWSTSSGSASMGICLAGAIALALVLVGVVGDVWAQRGRMLQVEVEPQELTLDETASVKVVVQARHVHLRVPSSEDFELASTTDMFGQPVFCMNMGYNVISGPCIYTFQLTPLKEGTLTIPPFTLVGDEMTRARGQQVEASEPVEIRVAKGSGKPRQKKSVRQPRNQGRSRAMAPQRGQAEEELKVPSPDDSPLTMLEAEQLERFQKYDVFLLPRFAKQNIFVNEPFRVDFFIYIANNAQVSQLQDLRLPELDGFRKEEVDVGRLTPQPVEIGERGYERYLLARYVLIPLKAGSNIIKAAEATLLINSTQFQQFGSGFSIQISGGTKPMSVFGPSLKVEIKEAPAGAPEGYASGNVGRFRLVPGPTPPVQPAGSWNMLRFDIEGEGNLYSVTPPALPPIPDLETREAHIDRSAVKATASGLQGKVTVQIPFRVNRGGTWTLPIPALVYLDPETGGYVTAGMEPLVVEAGAGENGVAQSAGGPVGQIRGLIREGGEVRGEWVLPRGYATGGLLGLLGVFLAALGVRSGWRAVSQLDPERRRCARLMKQSAVELAEARAQALNGDTKACFAALGRSIPLYLEGRFRFSAGSKTMDGLEEALVESGVSKELAGQLRQEMESADFGRFAPSAVQGEDCLRAVERTEELLGRLRRVKPRSRA